VPRHDHIQTLSGNDSLLHRSNREYAAGGIATTAAANSSVTSNRKIAINS
jgi:hypothetical protein